MRTLGVRNTGESVEAESEISQFGDMDSDEELSIGSFPVEDTVSPLTYEEIEGTFLSMLPDDALLNINEYAETTLTETKRIIAVIRKTEQEGMHFINQTYADSCAELIDSNYPVAPEMAIGTLWAIYLYALRITKIPTFMVMAPVNVFEFAESFDVFLKVAYQILSVQWVAYYQMCAQLTMSCRERKDGNFPKLPADTWWATYCAWYRDWNRQTVTRILATRDLWVPQVEFFHMEEGVPARSLRVSISPPYEGQSDIWFHVHDDSYTLQRNSSGHLYAIAPCHRANLHAGKMSNDTFDSMNMTYKRCVCHAHFYELNHDWMQNNHNINYTRMYVKAIPGIIDDNSDTEVIED